MDGTRSELTLATTFRIGRDGEQLPFLRSASQAALFIRARQPRNTESRSCGGHCHYLDSGRQSEVERRPPSVVGCGPQTATKRFNNGAADRQSHSAAFWFGGKECVENLFCFLGGQSHTCIAD